MQNGTARKGIALVGAVCLWTAFACARDLTFEERVKAQEAIERVYYSHQIGSTKPFDQEVPREVLEKKVRTYLKQSVALDRFWHTPVTAESLQREIERMARGTRMPERLLELYAALKNDPVLILECLARPALVDRLTRNFFAYDERIHGTAREEAEALRRRLASGELDPLTEDPRRTVMEVLREDAGGRQSGNVNPGNTGNPENPGNLGNRGNPSNPGSTSNPGSPWSPGNPGNIDRPEDDRVGGAILRRLPTEEFDRWVEKLPRRTDVVGAVEEERDEFDLRIVLERETDRLRVATYRIEKRSWDEWWAVREGELAEPRVCAVVPEGGPVPAPVALASGVRGRKATVRFTNCGPDDTWNDVLVGVSPPDPRLYHTAVWTGSLMVVWGGFNSISVLNTGSRYDPATDTWTPTSTVNAPSGRYYHSAVWTGSLMVVWGGYDGSKLHTGGRYDPATDTWTPTSTADAPSPRSSHTAVWAGSLMVVWGGYGGSSSLNTGGRYDPTTDTWTPTSTANAPSGRYYHTATWTGSLMLVWGGYGSSGYLKTGGRYSVDPPDSDGDGYTVCGGDCNDADPKTYPNAPESNDGRDNQCPGGSGYGVVDETSGDSGFHTPADKTEYSWPAQAGATAYEVARSSSPTFTTDCLRMTMSGTSWSDGGEPSSGGAFFYLNRPLAPHLGSWGQDSRGYERTNVCP